MPPKEVSDLREFTIEGESFKFIFNLIIFLYEDFAHFS